MTSTEASRNSTAKPVADTSINLGFERMKHNPQGITTAMQLYFTSVVVLHLVFQQALVALNPRYPRLEPLHALVEQSEGQ